MLRISTKVSDTWFGHKQKWKGCKQCVLHERRKKVVLARGTIPCEVLLVGEAPGDSEDVRGLPFWGPAGSLLDRIIEKAWDGKVSYALTNLVGCIPKGEDGRKAGEPEEECIKACRERLEEFIDLCRHQQIVAVGKLAASHLIDRADAEMIHPAAILRMDNSQKGLAYHRCIAVLEDVIVSF